MRIRQNPLPHNIDYLHAWGENAFVGRLRGTTNQASEVAAFDLDAKCLWRQGFEETHKIGDVVLDECWTFGRKILVALGRNGGKTNQFTLPLDDDEQIGAVRRYENSLLIAVSRDQPHPVSGMSGRLLRTTLSGEPIYSVTLPVEKIAYDGCAEMSAANGWKVTTSKPWTPRSWMPFGRGYFDALLLSSHLLMATYCEWPRSGIGCRYFVELESGSLLRQSRYGPTANAFVVPRGGFLFGNQGYGAFETHQFHEMTDSKITWASHGHCFARNDHLFCIEMANDLSQPQHIVELAADGTVIRLSERLPGYSTSSPFIGSDDSVYFWRENSLWRWTHAEFTSYQTVDLSALFATTFRFAPDRFGLYLVGGSQPQLAVIDL